MKTMFKTVAVVLILPLAIYIRAGCYGNLPSQIKEREEALEWTEITMEAETKEQVKLPPVPQIEVPEAPEKPRWTEEEVVVLTKMLWGEAGGVPSDTERSAVIWTVLNRQDMYDEGIVNIVTMPYQYAGYRDCNPVDEHLRWLVEDVLDRWCREHNGDADVGRTIPADYIYFSGDGHHNYFRNKFEGGVRWDWSLPSPYST